MVLSHRLNTVETEQSLKDNFKYQDGDKILAVTNGEGVLWYFSKATDEFYWTWAWLGKKDNYSKYIEIEESVSEY